MINTTTFNMMLLPDRGITQAYLLKGKKLLRRSVKIPLPMYDDTQDNEITVITNEMTSKIKGRFTRTIPKDVRKYYPSYAFSIENSIIAFNDLSITGSTSLNVMALDIEVGTTGYDPHPSVNKILTMGYTINGKTDVIYLENSSADDSILIKKLIDIIHKENVSLIVGYNSSKFDLPYILKRAYVHGIADEVIEKLSGKSDTLKEKLYSIVSDKTEANGEFGHILHHDIFNEVIKDQSLYKLKHRTLKDVGKYFLKNDPIKIDNDNMRFMRDLYDKDRNRIIDYQISDANLTYRLATEVYTNRVIDQANELSIPLNVMFNRSSTLILQVELLRKMKDSNLFIALDNYSKYESLYKKVEKVDEATGKVKQTNNPYQGAWTEAFCKGKYDNVHKYDYSGLYPSIIMTLNLSYETVSLNSVSQVENETALSNMQDPLWRKIHIDKRGSTRTVTIYDANQKSKLKIDADMNETGFIPRILLNFKDLRSKIKKKMKDMDKSNPLYIQLDSKQQMYKVMSNSTYGLLSNSRMPGCLPAGMVVTAFGRHIAGKLIELLEEQLGPDSVIELDTDGVLVTGKADIDDLNKEIKEYISNLLDIDISKVQVELEEEELDRIFIHKSKNYLLREKDGTLVIHGSALKSSRMPGVMDRFVQLLIDYGLNDKITKEELVQDALDIRNLSMDEFYTRVRLSKEISSYAMPTETTKAVEELVKLAGDKIQTTKGLNVDCIMLKDSLSGSNTVKVRQLVPKDAIVDYEYYEDMIRRMLNEMNLMGDDNDAGDLMDLLSTISKK